MSVVPSAETCCPPMSRTGSRTKYSPSDLIPRECSLETGTSVLRHGQCQARVPPHEGAYPKSQDQSGQVATRLEGLSERGTFQTGSNSCGGTGRLTGCCNVRCGLKGGEPGIRTLHSMSGCLSTQPTMEAIHSQSVPGSVELRTSSRH